jgi:hypothetical protein
MRGAFSVDDTRGERWDLAVEMLERGEGFVSIEPLLLYRSASGPRADGQLHAEVVSRFQDKPSGERAAAEVASGMHTLDLVLTDERVARLVARHGLLREYVTDYQTGRISYATIAPDGALTWSPTSGRT